MDSGSLPCVGGRDQNCPKEKEMQDTKVKSLQIAEKEGEAKSKGERERYTQLNAEFQRIARRDKKAFLNEQCQEIQEKIEWKRLEISLRKWEVSREHFMQEWAQ